MDETTSIISRPHLVFGLDAPLPDEILPGKGAILRVRGWCYSPEGALSSLALLVDDAVMPILNHSWARMDVFAEHCPSKDKSGYSLLSGFEGFVPFEEAKQDREVTLRLRATLKRGDIIERRLGCVRLQGGYGALPTKVEWQPASPRIAIMKQASRRGLSMPRPALAPSVCVNAMSCSQKSGASRPEACA